MTTVAGDYRLIVTQNTVTMGDYIVPMGKVESVHPLEKDYKGELVHRVQVWTAGGMGLRGKRVYFDFNCQTAEKMQELALGLIQQARASFSLYVTAIKPSNLIATGDGIFLQKIQFPFINKGYCSDFSGIIANVFFPDFSAEIDDSTLILSMEGSGADILDATRKGFKALSRQTYRQSDHLLWENPNPYSPLSPPSAEEISCEIYTHPPFYEVSPTTVRVDTVHDADEQGRGYWELEPLSTPLEKSLIGAREYMGSFIAQMRKVYRSFPSAKALWEPILSDLERRNYAGEPSNPFEYEIINNIADTFPKLEFEPPI